MAPNITKFLLLFVLLAGFALSKELDFTTLKERMESSETFEEFMKPYIYETSSNRLFLTYQNVLDLLKEIDTQFTYTRVDSIGTTIEGREMPLITIGENYAEFETKSRSENPPAIFLTSAHHAREVIGVTMNFYVVLNLLYLKVHNDTGINSLLRNHIVYSLPLVNVDGYALISKDWDANGIFNYIRKNRRNEGNCIATSIGVDLNRNYEFKWGLDNDGSSPSACQEDYRGKAAFSEPETQAVRDFITSDRHNVKIAINFHTWGNLFIIPFNYDNQWNKNMVDQPIYKLYEDIRDQGNLPQGMLFGNGKQTIRYTANGDATDWMATQNDMLAISPELGTKHPASNKFLPHIDFVRPIIEQNFPWINYTLHKLSAQIDTKIIKYEKEVCMIENCTTELEEYQKFHFEIMAENLGFTPAKNIEIKIEAASDVRVILPTDHSGDFQKSHSLTHPSLASQESKTWKLFVEIPTQKWKEMNEGSITENTKKAFLTLVNDKYPLIENTEKNTRTLSMASIISAEGYTPEEEVVVTNDLLYWIILAVLVGIVVLSLGLYCCIKKTEDRLDLEGKKHSEFEMGNYRNTPSDNENPSYSLD